MNPVATQPFPLLETKFAADGAEFSGYGSVFHNVDLGGDRIEPGAFAECLKRKSPREIAMLWMHDAKEPIGSWLEMREDPKGLFVRGVLNLEVQRAREARALLSEQALRGLSIGFRIIDEDYKDDVRVLRAVDLWEVSIVTFPMNPAAQITEIRSAQELEKHLRDAGLSRKAAKRVVAGGWPALDQRDVDGEAVAKLVADIKGHTTDIHNIAEKLRWMN